MIWARMLAYITGTVDQELLLRNEYLAAENRILRAQIKGRLLLSDAEKATLAEIAHRLGRKALEELAAVAKPDTLLAWYRKLIANKFDGSKFRKSWGRPRVDEETERLVVQMANENPGLWWPVSPNNEALGAPRPDRGASRNASIIWPLRIARISER
jgi:putative transposase